MTTSPVATGVRDRCGTGAIRATLIVCGILAVVMVLAAATAAIEDQDYLRSTRAKILATRERLSSALGELGFQVLPSQANFVWCNHKERQAKEIYERLKQRQVLVRYMVYDGYEDGLRITVGTEAEADRLLDELRGIV